MSTAVLNLFKFFTSLDLIFENYVKINIWKKEVFNITYGYCFQCKQNVLLVREEVDWVVVIILLCCTAGIGVFIYLMIYYSRPENRCVHCKSTVTSQSPGDLPQSKPSQIQTAQVEFNQETQDQVIVSQVSEKQNYCPFCGVKIEEDAKFCSSCGAKFF